VAEPEPVAPNPDEIRREMQAAVERIRAKLAEPGEIPRLLDWILLREKEINEEAGTSDSL
jgi:hypothetical protein